LVVCTIADYELDDLAREDDVFEVKDCEVVIVKFLGSVNRNDIV